MVLRFFELLPSLRQATVMVQAEVADRMAAVPGTKAYGGYTVKLRLLAKPAGRFAVAPGCFLPPPRVDSAVIRLERCEHALESGRASRDVRVVEAAFAQRRKTLRNSLRRRSTCRLSASTRRLLRPGSTVALRAETLPPEAFVDLARAIARLSCE